MLGSGARACRQCNLAQGAYLPGARPFRAFVRQEKDLKNHTLLDIGKPECSCRRTGEMWSYIFSSGSPSAAAFWIICSFLISTSGSPNRRLLQAIKNLHTRTHTTHARTRTHARTCTHTHARARTHTHTHTHKHIVLSQLWSILMVLIYFILRDVTALCHLLKNGFITKKLIKVICMETASLPVLDRFYVGLFLDKPSSTTMRLLQRLSPWSLAPELSANTWIVHTVLSTLIIWTLLPLQD